MMRYWLALVLCASSVSAQNVNKTVEVQVQDAPKNPTTLLQTDQGRGASIEGAKLSPYGKLVALYGVDAGDPNLPARETRGVLQIWNLATRQKVRDLVGHKQWIQRVFWSHDGQKLVSQSQDGQVLLWDAASGKQLLELSSAIKMASFPPEGTPAEQLQKWKALFERPQLIGFAPDDRHIYAIGGHVVLSAALQKALLETLEEKTNAVADEDAGKKPIISLPQHLFGTLLFWDARSGKASAPKDFGTAGTFRLSNALSAGGLSFLVSIRRIEDGNILRAHIEQRDLKTGTLQKTLDGDTFEKEAEQSKDEQGNIYFSQISADGRLALLNGGADNTRAQLWDIVAQKPLQVLADSNANFGRAFFVADNTKLLVAGRTGDILIFDVPTGKLERHLSGGHWGEIGTLDMTPDGHTLISVGSQDSVVQLWDLTQAAGAVLQARALAQDHNVRKIVPAPDGSFWFGYNNFDWRTDLQKGESLDVRHFNAEGEELEKISIPEEFLVGNVTFSSDFKLAAGYLATMPQPALLQGAGVGVWDLEQKKLLWHLPSDIYRSDALAFAPDGKTLVVGHGAAVELWDIETGKLLRRLLDSPSGINALTFSADGQTLAIGNDGGTIQLLDMETRKVRDEVTEDFAPRAVTFSPDGKYLLSGGNIETGDNPIGFKITLRDAKTKTLLREWTHDKGAQSEVERERLRREDKADGVRYFGGLAFSLDSKLIAFSHFGNPMRIDRAQTEIWDIATNTRVGLIPDRASSQMPTFSSDGKTVFTTDGNWIKSWALSEVLAQNMTP